MSVACGSTTAVKDLAPKGRWPNWIAYALIIVIGGTIVGDASLLFHGTISAVVAVALVSGVGTLALAAAAVLTIVRESERAEGAEKERQREVLRNRNETTTRESIRLGTIKPNLELLILPRRAERPAKDKDGQELVGSYEPFEEHPLMLVNHGPGTAKGITLRAIFKGELPEVVLDTGPEYALGEAKPEYAFSETDLRAHQQFLGTYPAHALEVLNPDPYPPTPIEYARPTDTFRVGVYVEASATDLEGHPSETAQRLILWEYPPSSYSTPWDHDYDEATFRGKSRWRMASDEELREYLKAFEAWRSRPSVSDGESAWK